MKLISKYIKLFMLLILSITYLNTNAAIYSSKATGLWTDAGTWTSGTPGTSLNNSTVTINSGHTVTLNSTLNFNNNCVLNVYGTLRINADFIINNNLTINVDGTLIITGNFTTNNNASVDIGGTAAINIGGNANFNNNNTITMSGGTLNVTGSMNGGTGNSITGTGTITTGGTYDNGGFTIQTGSTVSVNGSVLPIELIEFNAVYNDNKVEIIWKTATETNNKEFIIQRSVDGDFYIDIATIHGSGNSNSMKTYRYIDEISNKNDDVYYYRLKQIDYDGKFTVSKSYFVTLSNENDTLPVFYKADVEENNIILYINVKSETTGEVFIFSSTGSKKIEQKFMLNTGLNKYEIDKSDFKTGIYIVNIRLNNKVYTKEIMVK